MNHIKIMKQKTLVTIWATIIALLILILNNKVLAYSQESPAPNLSKSGNIVRNGEYSVKQEDLWKNKYLYCIDPDTKIQSGTKWGYKVSDDYITWNTSSKTLKNSKKNLNVENDVIWKLGYFLASEAKEEEVSYSNWTDYKGNSKLQNMIWEIVNRKNYYTGSYMGLESEYSFTWPMVTKTSEKVDTTIRNRKTIKETNAENAKMSSLEAVGIDLNKLDFSLWDDGEFDNSEYYAIGPYNIEKSIGDQMDSFTVSYKDETGAIKKYECKNFDYYLEKWQKSGSTDDIIDTILTLNPNFNDYLIITPTNAGNFAHFFGDESYLYSKNCKFYLVVKKDKASGIQSLNVKINREEWKGKIYFLNYDPDINGTSEKSMASQKLIYIDVNKWDNPMNVDMEVNLIPPVQVKLKKVDTSSAGSAVEGAKFKIEYSNGLAGETATSNSSGKVTFPQVQPAGPDEFTATITETSTPAGYKPLEKPIKLKFTYNESSAKWEVTKIKSESDENAGTPSVTNSSGTNVVNLTVTNKSIIEKLTLLKTSTVTELGAVEGAKFTLTLTNVESIKGYTLPTTGETKTIIVTTDENGEIVLEDIVIVDLNNDVTITITETEAPKGYKKIEGTITLTLKRQGNNYTISETKDDTVTDDEYKTGEVTETNHELTLNIEDIPIMNLGGIVWVEKEKTGKTPKSSDIYGDGNENEEEALGGVTVKLYKGTTKIAETISSDGNAQATYKNNKVDDGITVDLKKGEYMFTDIEPGNDYHVEFEYDGILYKALLNTKANAYSTDKKDSKIKEEPNRDAFNEATKSVSGSGKVSESTTDNGGWTIKYDTDSQDNKALYTGVYEGTRQQYVTAKTYNYLENTTNWLDTWNDDGTINTSHYAFNINCGLCKKYFDLNLGTDVASATVKINGQETTYTYDQILDGKLNDALNKKSNDYAKNYNLYLAYSDYNYRIDDYKVPNEDGSLDSSYGEAVSRDGVNTVKTGTELKIYVTYRLVLNNQSTHNATVDFVEYRYDSKYEFDVYDDNCKIDNADIIENNNNVLKLYTGNYSNDGKEIVSGNQKNIYITFKVKENGEQKCVLDTDYLNQAEILQYTTEEGGLVDADSAPGNAFIEHDADPEKTIRYEDDTDEANGIEITFKEKAERSISGKVFDDDSDNGVNDVIVQLIELIEINGEQYEYIWQETVAGKNEVKTTARNGYTGVIYEYKKCSEVNPAGTTKIEDGKTIVYVENINEDGTYQFRQGIIPGNYIVRFIYGDGTTYTLTDNVKTYNGEDYKSTYVTYNYNAEWYNNCKNNKNDKFLYEGENANISKAVDNEARRLKVMSYAVDVDKEKGAELAKLDGNTNTGDVLDNTWMCAETLKIKMTVDTDDKTTTSESASVANGTSPTTANTQFTNVNFGLMKRPQTKLVLEKHITGLTVKPVASGVNLIANATADIYEILKVSEGQQINLEGQKDGLSAFKSGRNNRNMWYLQTDTTELAQGADAYITYTYVVKNEGDKDYLNKDLVDFYEAVGVDEYENKLLGLEIEVKDAKKSKSFTNGTYISEFYYTGSKGTNDKEVLASVEEIQEALNPKVKFVDSTTDFSVKSLNVSKYVYKQDGTGIENETINETITTKTGTGKLLIGSNDTSKKLVVSVGLSASEIENGGVFDSYIAEVTRYTNAAGRRDQSTPANLSYVHSYDTGKILAEYNEEDEFWAETFRITKPTGEDKLTPVQIAIITITSVAVLGIGIILIKKFVLNK